MPRKKKTAPKPRQAAQPAANDDPDFDSTWAFFDEAAARFGQPSPRMKPERPPRLAELKSAKDFVAAFIDGLYYPGVGMDISPIRLFHPGTVVGGRPRFRAFLVADLCLEKGDNEGQAFINKVQLELAAECQLIEERREALEEIFGEVIAQKRTQLAAFAQAGGLTEVTEAYLDRYTGPAHFAEFEGPRGRFLVGHLGCDAILGLSLFTHGRKRLPRGVVIKYHGLACNWWHGWGRPILSLQAEGLLPNSLPEFIWDGGDGGDGSYMDNFADRYTDRGLLQAADAAYHDLRRLWRRI